MLVPLLLASFLVSKKVYLVPPAEYPWNWYQLVKQDNQAGLHINREGTNRSRCLAETIFAKGGNLTSPVRILARHSGRDFNLDRFHDYTEHDTVQKVADALRLPIDSHCYNVSCVQLAVKSDPNQNNQDGGPVLVAWPRSNLRRLAQALGVDLNSFNRLYPFNRFDLIWIVDTNTKQVTEYHQDCSKYGLYQNGTNKVAFSEYGAGQTGLLTSALPMKKVLCLVGIIIALMTFAGGLAAAVYYYKKGRFASPRGKL
jgi:hypothetical protein